MTRKCNQQLLFWQLEPVKNPVKVELVKESKNDLLEKYIEDKIWIQNHLEQKITEKKFVLERKREREAKEQRLLRRWQKQKGSSPYYPEEDFLVQTDCVGCGNLRLLRIDRPICSLCERRYELMYRPDQPTGENYR